MNWTATQITKLRLGLGWSVADFSRRFGVTSLTVQNWESNLSRPTADDLRQLDFLSFQLKNYCDTIQAQPRAESAILNSNCEQIHRHNIYDKN